MARLPLIPLVLLGGAAMPLAAQGGRPAAPPRVVVIENITVIDVEAGLARAGQRIVIRGDSIAAVGPVSEAAPSDATRTIDGTGLFAIPGLVDHHVHLAGRMEGPLERAVRGGVTLVQALAGDNRIAGNLARAVHAREIVGPEIAYASVMAGPGFFTDPRFIGAGAGYAPGTAPWAQAVTALTDLPVAIAAARGSGAEVLKVYAMMSGPLVAALTREAHRQGMRVVAHGTVFPARPSELVAAGVDVLTHVPYLSWQGLTWVAADEAWNRRNGPYTTTPPDGPVMTELLQAMAAAGTHLEPTLWVFHRTAADSALQRWSMAVVGAAHRLGIPMVAGTDGLIDANSTALPNIHKELELLVRAGLSPAQALASATIVPARLMSRGRTHGLLAAGRVADLVLLDANPLERIGHTTRIRQVIRRGVVIP
jgi:imidazolonepropionase-like amidohydrolase